MLKKIFKLTLLGIFLFFFSNFWILATSHRHIKPDIQSLEPADAVMILGARVFPNGRLSDVLRDRAKVAIQVYQAGKANKIIVSGDHGTPEYDEVAYVRDYLLANNIPPQDIFLDHAGFDTYDSLHRAQSIFQIKNLIISTQNTHLPRAIFNAKSRQINTQGISADLQSYQQTKQQIAREFLARPKSFLDVILNSKPKFLGSPIPITGDGQTTWD